MKKPRTFQDKCRVLPWLGMSGFFWLSKLFLFPTMPMWFVLAPTAVMFIPLAIAFAIAFFLWCCGLVINFCEDVSKVIETICETVERHADDKS